MDFKQFYLGCLSHASYYLGSDGEAAIIDPQRDVQQYIDEADSHGQKISGRRNVSSEIAMHLFIYRRRPDVGAVVHAHPPTATGFAAAGMPLDSALCSEIVITLDKVPLASYGTPGTTELADALAPLVGDHDAILMANHGVVTYG